MEEVKKERLVNVYEKWDGFKSFITSFLGVFVALLGMAVVFFVSSLQGTKEIKASNKVNAILIEEWRKENDTLFPEEKVALIHYQGNDYYFITEKNKEGEIESWYFAYDGGIDYVFHNVNFYILTSLTIVISLIVSQTNYTTAINSTMNTTKFLKTLSYYQTSKEKVAPHTQYIQDFCMYKNKQSYESAKRYIVESADVHYDNFISPDFDINKLEEWQKKRLEKIKKIKIERITPSDLLQEKTTKGYKVSLLPTSPEVSKRNYFARSAVQKTISSILSGLTVVFGIVLGEWVLGITYGFTVFMSFVMANIAGADYANGSLRQRYIAKGDLLNEFMNMKDYFEEEAKKVLEEKNKKETIKQEEESVILENEVLETFSPVIIANSKEI